MSTKKRSTIYLLLLGAIVILSITFAAFTSASFEDNVTINNMIEYEHFYLNVLSPFDELTTLYFNNKIESVNDLENLADVIVIGKISSKEPRKNKKQATLTPFDVDRWIKGESNTEIIYIYEPSNFHFMIDDNSGVFFSTGGYQLMQNNNKYVLFLKHLEVPPNYALSEKEKISFVPVSTIYAKYHINTQWSPTTIKPNEDLLYGDIMKYDIVLQDEWLLEHYLDFQEHVLEKYGM